MKSRWFAAIALCLVTTSAQAGTLREWTMPNALSRPMPIDAAHGRVVFVDAGFGYIDELLEASNTLVEWRGGGFTFQGPGSVEVYNDPALGTDVAFATSVNRNAIARLNLSTNQYTYWTFGAPVFGGPRGMSVDRASVDVWFSAYAAAQPTTIVQLRPSTGMARAWPLPVGTFGAAAVVDGVVFRSNTEVYFSVNSPIRKGLVILNPTTNQFRIYNWSTSGGTQIAVNAAGEAFSPQGGGGTTVLRMRPAANLLTVWSDPGNVFQPYVSLLGNTGPFLTATAGAGPNITRLDPLAAGMNFASAPAAVTIPFVSVSPVVSTDTATRVTTVLPLAAVGVAPAGGPALFRYTPGGGYAVGGVSVRSATAVWLTETAARRIACLTP